MKRKNLLLGILSGILILAAAGGGLYFGLNTDSLFREKTKEELLVDVGWYSEEGEEFTISTVDQLYDVAALSQFYSFEGQTLKLDADLTVNKGIANEWTQNAPARKWQPIRNFAGTFDGQGHVISGLYGFGADSDMGLFANVKPKATVRNFRLVNSYFRTSGKTVGAVASNGSGTYANIYTDAIVETDAQWGAGGLIGKVDAAGESAALGFFTRITGCLFAGDVRLRGNHGAFGGGFVGLFSSGTLELKQCLSGGKISSVTTVRAPHMGGFIGDSHVDIGTNILNMEGCLNTTELTANNVNTCGSVIGRLRPSCTATFTNCYVTAESWNNGVIRTETSYTGNALSYARRVLEGFGGYEWTELDFENYWAVVEGGTPVLQAFTDKIPSVAGLKKAYSTDWYDPYADELVIDSREKLLGLFVLAYTKDVTYYGQTIKLADDFVLNEGSAEDWAEEAPTTPWLPLGTWDHKFEGVFDGQGHTISGAYITGTTYVGLLGVTARETEVKDLRLVNSYVTGQSIVGGVVGRTLGSLDSIYCDAIVKAENGFVGGIAGQSLDPQQAPVTLHITNCWFDGTVESTGEGFAYAGGILGDNRNNHVTIAHCLNTGAISSNSNRYNPIMGGITASATNEDAVTLVQDCLNVGALSAPESEPKGFIGSLIGRIAGTGSKVKDSYGTLESWEKATCYFGDQKSTSGQWPTKQLVGYGGYQWTTLDFDNYWAVVEGGTPVLKTFADSVPSVSGVERMVDLSWYDEDADTYVIDSAAKLIGFNMLAGTTDFEGKTVKLGADIALNKGLDITNKDALTYVWTPVGTWGMQFKGTFDGQGHTVSGIHAEGTNYVGFFGVLAKGATVKNFRLTGSYFTGEAVVGGVVGRTLGDIDSVYCSATVISSGGYVGGIAGQSMDPVSAPLKQTITNCWFDGRVESTGEGFAYAGGILGENRNNHMSIAHCLNTGAITTASNRANPIMGGITASATNAGAVTLVQDCFNAGALTAPQSGPKGFIGSLMGRSVDSQSKVTDSYGTLESWEKATCYFGDQKSVAGQWPAKQLTGKGGFQWTTLDFDKYWAIVEGGTPVLKTFASSAASTAGLERLIDTSWYDSSKSTYVLDTAAKLIGFNILSGTEDFAGKTVKLGADIALNKGLDITDKDALDYVWTPVGSWDAQFKGTFDGQGHTVSGIHAEGVNYVGFFGVVAKDATVKDFRLTDSYFAGDAVVGGVAGRTLGKIESVYCSAAVTAANGFVGGIAGQSLEPRQAPLSVSITDCWFDGTVSSTGEGFAYAGGIMGENRNNNVTIANCLFTGTVTTASNRANPVVGGIQGATNAMGTTTITGCLGAGTLQAEQSAAKGNMGSVLGTAPRKNVELDNCYGAAESWAPGTAWLDGTVSTTGQMPRSSLTGQKGYTNTLLDFTAYWTVIEDDTPQLKRFATGKTLEVSGARPDVSWYDDTEGKTFYINTLEEYLGFLRLAEKNDFATQTIKLGADIVLNEGDAKTWGTTAPENVYAAVGNFQNQFAGTFDGQGHTVSGLYVKGSADYSGAMFGVIAKGSTVRNFRLVNSYVGSSANVTGSIVGRAYGNVDTIYSDATVVADGIMVGGIVGQVWDTDVTISNCWYAGELTCNNDYKNFFGYVGGILGECRAAKATVTNCLYTGSITLHDDYRSSKMTGGIFGGTWYGSAGTVAIESCVGAGSIINLGANTDFNGIGSILGFANNANSTVVNCYGLDTCSGKTTWIGGTASDKGTLTAGQLTGANAYANTMLSTDYWAFIEGELPQLKSFQTGTDADLSGVYKPDTSWYDDTEGKEFTLTTKEQFLGFAQLAQSKTFAAQTVKLGTDVTLNQGADITKKDEIDYVWTPLGDWNTQFKGTFDGQGHTVSGVYAEGTNYVGLFGVTGQGSLVKDVKLVNSYFKGDAIVGGIVGRALGDVERVHCSATVVATGGFVGGIVGQSLDTVNAPLTVHITECWFDGTVSYPSDAFSYAGGILGENRNNHVTVAHCLFTGSVVSNSNRYNTIMGGIVGMSNTSAMTTVTDCLASGTLQADQSANKGYMGSILGTSAAANAAVTNCCGTAECWSGTAWIDGVKSTEGVVVRASILGEAARTATSLDFTGYWVVNTDDVPGLKCFAAAEEPSGGSSPEPQ